MSTYTDNGYEDREEYLKSLAHDYGIPIGIVRALAELLGPNEDFDGLITGLEDHVDDLNRWEGGKAMSTMEKIIKSIESRGCDVLGVFSFSRHSKRGCIVWVDVSYNNNNSFVIWGCSCDGATYWGDYYDIFSDSAKGFVSRIARVTDQEVLHD